MIFHEGGSLRTKIPTPSVPYISYYNKASKFKHVFSSKLYLYLEHLGRRLVADTTILQNIVTDQVNLAHWITDKNNMVQD